MDALAQAKEITDRILALTKNLTLTGAKEHGEAELESYIELLEERETLIEELTDLKHQMDDEEISSAEFEEIKKTINEITELDKKHIKLMEQLHEKARASYKEIKQGQRIHLGYNPLPGNEVSNKFDIKQ